MTDVGATIVSDNFSYTELEAKLAAKETAGLISSPKTMITKHKDGSCDVYKVKEGKEEKAIIINVKMSEDDNGSWKISCGKFLEHDYCIGPFVDGSEFDKELSGGRGIREILNTKLAMQQRVLSQSNYLGS